ncbi:unnamed protein product, partial [Aphanomyces euteiches]
MTIISIVIMVNVSVIIIMIIVSVNIMIIVSTVIMVILTVIMIIVSAVIPVIVNVVIIIDLCLVIVANIMARINMLIKFRLIFPCVNVKSVDFFLQPLASSRAQRRSQWQQNQNKIPANAAGRHGEVADESQRGHGPPGAPPPRAPPSHFRVAA